MAAPGRPHRGPLPPEEAAVKTLGLGASDFVRKPFRVRELLARIQAQLRMRAILRSAYDSLRLTEEELARARAEAESRRKLVDILREVTGDLTSDEIYHVLEGEGLFNDATAQNYIRQGVTTLMEGNDGSSPIPVRPFLDNLCATPISVNRQRCLIRLCVSFNYLKFTKLPS